MNNIKPGTIIKVIYNGEAQYQFYKITGIFDEFYYTTTCMGGTFTDACYMCFNRLKLENQLKDGIAKVMGGNGFVKALRKFKEIRA
jgi:hypothetical protein